MSYPHDYYRFDPDHPELHNRGEGRHYLEPDWHATRHDAQLPALSAIGRGPRGEGLYVGASVNQDGEVSFTLNSTLTGEVVWTSPNLAPWEIEFTPTVWKDIVAGIPAILDIKQTRGNQTHTTHAYLPPGEEGSLIYLLGTPITRRSDCTYTTTVADLTLYGRAEYQNRPVPRPNDMVMCGYRDSDDTPIIGLAIGVIENVGGTTRENYQGRDLETPTNVVFTVNNYIPMYNGRLFGITYVEDMIEIDNTTGKFPIPFDAYDVFDALNRGDDPIILMKSRQDPNFVITFRSWQCNTLNGELVVTMYSWDGELHIVGHDKFMMYGGLS